MVMRLVLHQIGACGLRRCAVNADLFPLPLTLFTEYSISPSLLLLDMLTPKVTLLSKDEHVYKACCDTIIPQEDHAATTRADKNIPKDIADTGQVRSNVQLFVYQSMIYQE